MNNCKVVGTWTGVGVGVGVDINAATEALTICTAIGIAVSAPIGFVLVRQKGRKDS